MKLRARTSLIICYVVILAVHLYYPKWRMSGSEATLSYDVSGYYLYLPAVFIYQDIRQVAFLPEILNHYGPSSEPYQTFPHESGRQVMKYSMGQSVMFLPFFAAAHAYALLSDNHPADGFSRPYQLAISLGSLLVSFLGLYLLMLVLRPYFHDSAIAGSLLIITLATNYLNYSAVDGAMTHNYLFTLYATLILLTQRFYQRPPNSSAAGTGLAIGLTLGMMALCRPTEIVACFIPLLWGIDFSKKSWSDRVTLLTARFSTVGLAVAACIAVGSLQIIYWKYVTGNWIVYSYQDQGFDWLQPHLVDGLFSYKAGWLTYTPAMWLALIGFLPLAFRGQKGLFLVPFLHTLVFIYIAFSWSVWWYGGSLGQRTMVQAYAVLALPLTAMVQWCLSGKIWKGVVFIALCLLFTAHNLWFTHQAHRGGLLAMDWTNRAYYWRTLFTFEHHDDDRLLLDNPEQYRGSPRKIDTLYVNDFEGIVPSDCSMTPIKGKGSVCLGRLRETSELYSVGVSLTGRQWIRATIDCKISEGMGADVQEYTRLRLRFYRNGEETKHRELRLQRVLNRNWSRSVSIDARAPREGADSVSVEVWNGGAGKHDFMFDNLSIVTLE